MFIVINLQLFLYKFLCRAIKN